MTSLFDRFVKNMSDEGIEIDRNSSATSALVNSSAKNVEDKAARQVHSQCSHTNFKDCSRNEDENLDNLLLDKLASNRESARLKS